MSDPLFFSVIIPTYNRAAFIEKTIRSVLNQDYPHFEVLVIDDGSTDQTEDAVKALNDPRIRYYKKENEERGAARNFGAKKAKGDYINFLDSDDLLYSNHLASAQVHLEKLRHPEVLYHNYDIKDIEGNILKKQKKNSGIINFKLSDGNILSCNGIFLRKDISQQFTFHEDVGLSGTEDWELWLRLARKFNFYYSNEITSTIVNHSGRSVVNTTEEKLLQRKNLLLRFISDDMKDRQKFMLSIKKIESHFDSYISLHLMLDGHKKRALFYLKNSFIKNPRLLFNRRLYAIFKHLLLSKSH
jgi:glycosyltransferase involved in cell wall biosynthesis